MFARPVVVEVSSADLETVLGTTRHSWVITRRHADVPELRRQEEVEKCHLLREIVGNPFRPFALDPAWLRWSEGLVARLGQSIYEDRGFERLPILADALEDAGCTDAAILDHLRGPGPHARGCWALDALLGKE
jgi:hypothetical protein